MIAELEESLAATPYSLEPEARQRLMLEGLNALTAKHYERCLPYRRIIDGYWRGKTEFEEIGGAPYLPVSIFKTQIMQSVPDTEVRLTLTSSGTTGQAVSRIPLDAETSSIQQRALASSLRHVLVRLQRIRCDDLTGFELDHFHGVVHRFPHRLLRLGADPYDLAGRVLYCNDSHARSCGAVSQRRRDWRSHRSLRR